MIYWGWYNGSMYHDLHGAPGIRTRFMTLWQMMAVGALAVTLESPAESMVYRSTFALLFLQIFITYLWWSVGIYDRVHRKLNVPYTVCYLLSFALLITTLFVPQPYKRLLFVVILFLNYLPFGLTALRYRKVTDGLDLSTSMTERLGLFAIIIFGESILGVINGVNHLEFLNFTVWLCFGLGILIVFALWWIFFSIISDRECRKGMVAGYFLSSSYILAFASLGMIGASFPALLGNLGHHVNEHAHALQLIFGSSLALFLSAVALISRYLVFPDAFEQRRKNMQLFVILTGLSNLGLICLLDFVPVWIYLLSVLITLLTVIVVFTRIWFRIELEKLKS